MIKCEKCGKDITNDENGYVLYFREMKNINNSLEYVSSQRKVVLSCQECNKKIREDLKEKDLYDDGWWNFKTLLNPEGWLNKFLQVTLDLREYIYDDKSYDKLMNLFKQTYKIESK